MDKLIGQHRKGNSNDNFGFIKSATTTNLFIHDKEFKDDIDRFDGREVYVTFRIRASKIKKGNNEGYDGCSLDSETDTDFLLDILNKRIELLDSSSQNYGVTELCKIIISRLAKINISEEQIGFFRTFFEVNNLEELVKNNSTSSKFLLMKFGLQTFFPKEFENLENKINELQEAELLRQMGFQGADKYDALTETFFNNFYQFEIFYKKFPQNVNKEFIYKIILESETLPFDKSFESIKRFVELIKGNVPTINAENAFTLFSNLSTPKIRLYLWLNDLTDAFDFAEYKESIWNLERKDQSRFIKKMFYWKSKGQINFTLNDLSEIKVFNIDFFREVKKNQPEIDYINLDFNVSLLFHILRTISDIKQFDKDVSGKIFEYFLEYVKDYKDIQHIDFFYPKCKGRTVGAKKKVITPEIGESGEYIEVESIEFNYYHHKEDKPLHHKFCDGQQDKNNKLGFPADKPYSWCTGLPCFDPSSSKLELNDDYNEWTIKEFLHILEIPYEPNNISYLLGYINKANLLIDRLKCNGCNNLMRPSGQNKFTFHIINNFHCATESCTEINKKVYLNHCLNKNCANIIDSRASKKCTHEGYDASCGWYICDSCYSCCGTNVITRVIERKQENNQTYKCSPIGHDELKKTFCYHCGDKMKLNKEFYLGQQKIIKSLIDTQQKKFVEHKENKNGFWRFKLNFNAINANQREDGIIRLNSNGFKLSESRTQNHIYFVDHLISIALKCNNVACPNEEIFSPNKPAKWKAFHDKHDHLNELVKKFFETGKLKYIENNEDTQPPSL